MLFLSVAQYLPSGGLRYLIDHAPSPRLDVLRRLRKTVTDVARNLVEEKSAALLQGKGSKDIMSLIGRSRAPFIDLHVVDIIPVKANNSENAATRLSEEEMIAQMQFVLYICLVSVHISNIRRGCRTIILAGHETTANSLSWTLLELARKPEIQKKLRQEIRSKQREVDVRGDSTITTQDLDSMPYLTAVMKVRFAVLFLHEISSRCPVTQESLRFHAVVPNNFRQAGGDDVLPLSKPIMTSSGEVIHELPIPKGIKIVTSIAGYNRYTTFS